ncbi:MAG: 2-succinyl-5-enolpyruvyl-6-hydroxy-3-cyclohexene-1-carboxylic-acid synthase [Candidatus Kapaibacterium sp.]|nr:MAG: 2-succinyl-5-enolpyruvyl-6-hydroxy-3-cyclohexene-1-carboxylic-acid synthase [Candidatus Kapabacteria bacterium]
MNTGMKAENITFLWARLIIEECLRNGIRVFCISSGSRSTPLAYALAQASTTHNHLEIIHCADERAAAFYALGYARAQRIPAALICTSGTAVANYLPAIVEAAQDAVPMLVLTADRPPELLDTGANQAIKQHAIFGEYVRWYFDMPCPNEAISPAFVLSTISHACFRAVNTPSGAVHINCQFRERPPSQQEMPAQETIPVSYMKPLQHWLQHTFPFTRSPEHHTVPTAATIHTIAQILASAKFPLLAVGRLGSREERDAVMQCAYMWRVPIVADIASGLRLHDIPNTVTYFDQILLHAESLEAVKPDVVLHIGGSFVSKRLRQWFAALQARQYILLDETPFRHDPNHQVTMRVQSHIPSAMNMLYKAANSFHTESDLAVQAFHLSQGIEEHLEKYLAKALEDDHDISEITAAMLVSKHIPSEHGLFLSNSMPIRDMDMFGLTQHESGYIHVGTNRGASGIDGILATASGFALGVQQPVTLMIGDLALIHDINSTLLAAKNPVPLIIIAINNNGGGIFSFLPIAKEKNVSEEAFERFWGTPHNVAFDGIAHFAGLLYEMPRTTREFATAYKQALANATSDSPQSTLLEIQTNRQNNVEAHKQLQSEIISLLRG